MNGVKVTTTWGDVAAGEPQSSCDCPVARASRRALNATLSLEDRGRRYSVMVDGYSIEVWQAGLRLFEADLPEDVRDWIIDYDSGHADGCPIDFEIDLKTGAVT